MTFGHHYFWSKCASSIMSSGFLFKHLFVHFYQPSLVFYFQHYQVSCSYWEPLIPITAILAHVQTGKAFIFVSRGRCRVFLLTITPTLRTFVFSFKLQRSQYLHPFSRQYKLLLETELVGHLKRENKCLLL